MATRRWTAIRKPGSTCRPARATASSVHASSRSLTRRRSRSDPADRPAARAVRIAAAGRSTPRGTELARTHKEFTGMNYDTHDWAIVLAAGEGTRLRSLTTMADGVPVPKQFCSLDG